MVEEQFEDQFSDGDLADPKNFPDGVALLGEISGASVEETEPRKWRKFEKPLKDGRTEVPVITLTIRAKKFAGGGEIDPIYFSNFTSDFWMGKGDTVSRHMLANLVGALLGLTTEEKGQMSIREMVKSTLGAKVSFVNKLRSYVGRDGMERTQQQPTKLKAATAEEVALLM